MTQLRRQQARPLHNLPDRPTKLRPWRLGRLAWGDFAAILWTAAGLGLLGWQMTRFLEGR